jgi:ABC-type glutathione transport system ATPase component
MKNGKLVEVGAADDILSRPQHEYTRPCWPRSRLKRAAA